MKYLFGIIVTFAAVFASDFLIHGIFLKEAYEATAAVWRPESEMMTTMKYMMAGQILFSIAFCCLLIKISSVQTHLIRLGICYGFWLGLMTAGSNLIWYAVLPIPVTLAAKWCLFAFIQSIILGAIVGAVLSFGSSSKKQSA